MNRRSLFKLFGGSGVFSGVMIVLARVMQVWLYGDSPLSAHGADRLFVPLVGIPALVGSVLFLLAVTGLYLYQAEKAGVFGFLSFLFAFAGISLSIGANWTYAFGSPYLASTAAALLDADFGHGSWGVFGQGFIYSYLLAGIGYLVFAVSTTIAGSIPRWIGILMLLSMLLAAVLPISTDGGGGIVLNALMAIGPIFFGWHLWRVSHAEVDPAQGDAA